MKQHVNLFNDSGWQDASEYPDATKQKVLRNDNGAKTILLKLPEKFYMPPHSHLTVEQHFILRG